MPAQTTRPPGRTHFKAAGTRAPTGANRIAPSSHSPGCSSEPPAHTAPSPRAKRWPAASPGRVKANTRRPWAWATWASRCAAAHLLAQVAHAQGRRVFAFTRPGDAAGQRFARGLGAVRSEEHTSELQSPI